MAGPYDLTFDEQVSSEAEQVEQAKENEPAQEEVKEEQQEAARETEQQESEKKENLYANKYKTVGQLFKACETLAAEMDDDIDLTSMNAKEAEEYYLQAQKKFFAGGFKRNKEKAAQVKQNYQQDSQVTQEQFQQFLKQQQQSEQPKPKSIVKFDGKRYSDLMMTDPESAAELLEDYINGRIETAVYNEGAKFAEELKPFVEQQRRRASDEANNNAWSGALDRVEKFVKEYGDGDFKALEKDMNELVLQNRRFYQTLIEEEGHEQAVLHLYREAHDRSRFRAEREQFDRERAEFAKQRNGEVDEEIQATKEAARISSTMSGTPKMQSKNKPTEEEMVHAMLSRRTNKSGPYDIDY